VQRHLLAQQVLPLPVQVVVLEQRVDEGGPKLALSIQPEYQVGCECSHRVEQLQHQSLLELALLFWLLPSWQVPSLPQGQRPLQVSYLGTSPSTFAQQVLQQLMMLT
jgi:hypothetical protein